MDGVQADVGAQDHEPANWEKVAKVVQLQDYALKELGAESFFEDVSDAGFFGLWDPYALDWSDRLLSLLRIPRSLFPAPTASGTCVGAVSAAAAEHSGLKKGTPLCVGAGDQNSAAVGAGIVHKGFLSVSLGTGGLAAAYLDVPFPRPQPQGDGGQPRRVWQMAIGGPAGGGGGSVQVVP